MKGTVAEWIVDTDCDSGYRLWTNQFSVYDIFVAFSVNVELNELLVLTLNFLNFI